MTEDRHKEEGRAHLRVARPEDESREWKVYVSDEGEEVSNGSTNRFIEWAGTNPVKSVLFGVVLICVSVVLLALTTVGFIAWAWAGC